MLCRIDIDRFRFGVVFGALNRDEILAELKSEGSASGILVFPYGTLPAIDLKGEAGGVSGRFSGFAGLSDDIRSAVFCGVETRMQGEKFLGAAIFYKGALADIANRTQNVSGDAFRETGKIKIFSLKAGRIGLLIDTDCLLAENWAYLAPVCDLILCISRGNSEDFRGTVREFSKVAGTKKLTRQEKSGLSIFPYLFVDEGGAEWAE